MSLRTNQRGATLLTALMILIILTILALSVAQVTGLQERMAGLYRSDQQAFQYSEEELRDAEFSILQSPPGICFEGYIRELPATWFNGSATREFQIENLAEPEPGTGGSSMNALLNSADASTPLSPGAPGCAVFRVSGLQYDDASNTSSRAVVQSIFIP